MPKDIVSPDVYEKISNISDQLMHAVIGYTFDCFADMLAGHGISYADQMKKLLEIISVSCYIIHRKGAADKRLARRNDQQK